MEISFYTNDDDGNYTDEQLTLLLSDGGDMSFVMNGKLMCLFPMRDRAELIMAIDVIGDLAEKRKTMK